MPNLSCGLCENGKRTFCCCEFENSLGSMFNYCVIFGATFPAYGCVCAIIGLFDNQPVVGASRISSKLTCGVSGGHDMVH